MLQRPLAPQTAEHSIDLVVTDGPLTPDVDASPTRRGLHQATAFERGVKRAMDLALGTVLLLVLTPVIVLLAVAIRLDSRGPAVFTQTRVGRDGRTFRLFKFRSMQQGAEGQREALELLNECSGPVFKIREDPRVTRVGRVMRRLSFDELPQLLNVVMGQMSLVGPRPPLPAEVAVYSDRHRRRLLVKPGLTCIWQTSGRSDLGFEEWVDLDIEYIETWTLLLDVRLLLRTLPAVVSGRGAY